MASFNRAFFRGFFTLLPVAVTIYIIYSAIFILENILGSVLRLILPDHFYIPGFGFVLTLLVIYLFGLMLNNFLAERIYVSIETRLLKVPFFKAIYSPLKDLMNLFSQTKGPQKVVLVQIAGLKMLGIVTREHFSDIKLDQELTDEIAVYLPFSYGMGGFTILIPRKDVTPVEIPIERAMSLAITGWVKADKQTRQPEPPEER